MHILASTLWNSFAKSIIVNMSAVAVGLLFPLRGNLYPAPLFFIHAFGAPHL
jgi:hypothetical protein